VAKSLRRLRDGKEPKPFRYRDKGSMATIGRNDAVADLPLGLRCTGRLGWAMWLGLHLVELIGFRNRASVLVDWAWNYVTWDRGARIILRPPPPGGLDE
jgi:NADH dehydrogenase